MELVLVPLFKSAFLPLFVGGAVALICARFIVGDKPAWVLALALVCGFCAGFFSIAGFSGFPPRLVADWLPMFAILALPLFLFSQRLSFGPKAGVAILALAITVYLQLKPRLVVWSTSDLLLWGGGFLIASALLWLAWEWSHDHEGEDVPERLIFASMAATAASLPAVFGSAKMAQLAGVLGSVTGGLFLAKLLVRDLRIGSIINALVVILVTGFLIQAYIYAEIPGFALIVSYLSAFAVLLMRLSWFRKRPLFIRVALAAVIPMIPVIIVMIRLAQLDAAAQEDYYY